MYARSEKESLRLDRRGLRFNLFEPFLPVIPSLAFRLFCWRSMGSRDEFSFMNGLKCVYEGKAQLGEGVFWSEREKRVYWVDIVGRQVCRFDPSSGVNEAVSVGQEVGAIVERVSGGLVAGLKDGVYSLDFDSGSLAKLCDPMEGNSENRLNDGKAGPDGRFYVGGMSDGPTDFLFRIEKGGTDWSKVESGISISNGLCWSADARTFYYIDSPRRVVWAYDFDLVSGEVSNRRVVVDVRGEECIPDGMTIDVEGMLWVAFWDGWAVRRYDPNTGEMLQEIRLPVSRVTCCAFGGDDLDTLYITTASAWLEEAALRGQPLAGGLFAVKPGVKGRTAFLFGEGEGLG